MTILKNIDKHIIRFFSIFLKEYLFEYIKTIPQNK